MLKRPLILLIGLVLSLIFLSILFPSDPNKPDIIAIINKINGNSSITEQDNNLRTYKIIDTKKVDNIGNVLVWSADGKYFYYSKPVGDNMESGSQEIWTCDTRGNKRKIIGNLKLYNISNAKLSPDGSMLTFISTMDSKSSLYLYNVKNNTIMDISYKSDLDTGVTSYDWDDYSLNIIMSVGIVKPKIVKYDINTQKFMKLDISLKSCSNVFFYSNGIIYSDQDGDGKYKIYTADKYGNDIIPVTDGQKFVLSPDRSKLAILTNEDGDPWFKIYYIATKQSSLIMAIPIYRVQWLSNSINLIYSTEQDCTVMNAYKGSIYFLEKDLTIRRIDDVVYPLFSVSKNGDKIAMTSPDFIDEKSDNKGVFIGKIHSWNE